MPGSPIQVKICGITTPETYRCCLAHRVDYIGIMQYAQSPRYIALDQAGAMLSTVSQGAKTGSGKIAGSKIVVVTVNATDDHLDAIVRGIAPDVIQCHGDETPQRIAAIKQRYALSVIKALSIRESADIQTAHAFRMADYWLWDAKPLHAGMPSGGNALSFDWSLLADHQWSSHDRPWFLAGGLDADNVQQAIRISGARMIDLSSGVEESRGVKSVSKITALMQNLHAYANRQ